MASKIVRKTAQLFGVSAGATGVEEFASKQTGGTLVYSIDPSDLQTAAWSLGWVASIYQGAFAPYYQDRNAVDLVAFYQIAYLLQQGIPEWDASTTYFQNSVVQNGGSVYISLADSNLNNVPPAGASNAYWQLCFFPSTNQVKNPTRTVITIDVGRSGTYVPPAGCVRLYVRLLAGGGGGGCDSSFFGPQTGGQGGQTTFGSITCGGGNGGTGGPSGVGGTGGVATGGDINISGSNGSNASTSGNGFGGGSKVSSAIQIYMPPYHPVYGGGSVPYFTDKANYGCGGNAQPTSSPYPGACGGSGSYAEKNIISPDSSYLYSVGEGGFGGQAFYQGTLYGDDFVAGGNAGSGILVIDEFYF